MKKKKLIHFLIMTCSSLWLLFGINAIAAEPEPGTIIGLDNWKQYEEYLTPALIEQIKMGLSFPVAKDRPELLNPPPGYIKASERNRGKVKLGADGGLNYWTGGLPFPKSEINLKDPQAGLKVAYNHERRPKGDDQTLQKYVLKMVDPRGNERSLGGLKKSWN